MNMKLLFTVTAVLAVISTAHARPAKPKTCPSPASLASAGLESDFNARDRNGLWSVGRRKHNYGTQNIWTFAVGRITANDPADAFKKAQSSLASLTFLQGPFYVDELSRWACSYTTRPGYVAAAVTPQTTIAALDSINASK